MQGLRFESNVKLGITLTLISNLMYHDPFESNVKLGITLTEVIL